MKKAIETLIEYFDPETIVKDYTFRDGLTVAFEAPILPDTLHSIAFEYKHVRVVLRIALTGLTILRSEIDEDSFSNNGLRSECVGWIFYDGENQRGPLGDIDINRLSDVRFRFYFVEYIMSHVNAMLRGENV